MSEVADMPMTESQSKAHSMLHVAIVIEQFNPRAGGAERSTAQIAQELVQRGHRVTVLAGAAPDDLAVAEGVTLHAYSRHKVRSAARVLLFRRWALQRLAAGEFDVSLSITMAVPADVIQPRAGTVREALVRSIAMRSSVAGRCFKRSLSLLSPKQQTMLFLERRAVADPAVGRFVAVSGYVREELRRHYDLAESRVEMIPNAAVMPTDADASQRAVWRDQVRGAFGVPEDAVLFLFPTQDPRRKGYQTLLGALRELARRERRVVVLLAGMFGYRQHAQAVAAGVREQVRFVGPTRHMAPLYAAADATVLPTFYDPASKVVIESLMMGTPAISSGCNGASEFILPPDSAARGRVVNDPADDAALADAMLELADPRVRQACAQATAGLAEQLTMARHVDRLERVLLEAARGAEVAPAGHDQVGSGGAGRRARRRRGSG